jgi:hypothetical protein
MNNIINKKSGRRYCKIYLIIASCIGLSLTALAAWADQSSAQAAISRADGKIETATRQASIAGDQGNQVYTLARTRLQSARDALTAGRDKTAEMLADETSVLADLTVEKAKLDALQTSYDLVANTAAPPSQVQ